MRDVRGIITLSAVDLSKKLRLHALHPCNLCKLTDLPSNILCTILHANNSINALGS